MQCALKYNSLKSTQGARLTKQLPFPCHIAKASGRLQFAFDISFSPVAITTNMQSVWCSGSGVWCRPCIFCRADDCLVVKHSGLAFCLVAAPLRLRFFVHVTLVREMAEYLASIFGTEKDK